MSKKSTKPVWTRKGWPPTSDPKERLKLQQREASRRYYAKKPKNPPRIPYSPEEKKRRRKETNARYYAKNREKILDKIRRTRSDIHH